jgi:hypothetical protein
VHIGTAPAIQDKRQVVLNAAKSRMPPGGKIQPSLISMRTGISDAGDT